jgi:hypothetical protein
MVAAATARAVLDTLCVSRTGSVSSSHAAAGRQKTAGSSTGINDDGTSATTRAVVLSAPSCAQTPATSDKQGEGRLPTAYRPAPAAAAAAGREANPFREFSPSIQHPRTCPAVQLSSMQQNSSHQRRAWPTKDERNHSHSEGAGGRGPSAFSAARGGATLYSWL